VPKGLLSRGKINLILYPTLFSLFSLFSLFLSVLSASSLFSLRLDRLENDGRLTPRVKGKASGRLHGGGRSTRQHGAVHDSKRLSPPYVTRVRRLSRALFHPRLSFFSLPLFSRCQPSALSSCAHLFNAFCNTRFENRWIDNLSGRTNRLSF